MSNKNRSRHILFDAWVLLDFSSLLTTIFGFRPFLFLVGSLIRCNVRPASSVIPSRQEGWEKLVLAYNAERVDVSEDERDTVDASTRCEWRTSCQRLLLASGLRPWSVGEPGRR